jgi:hypothetical protein
LWLNPTTLKRSSRPGNQALKRLPLNWAALSYLLTHTHLHQVLQHGMFEGE